MPPKPIKKSQLPTPKHGNYLPCDEWIEISSINAWMQKHLQENPDKITFGIDEQTMKLCIMVSR